MDPRRLDLKLLLDVFRECQWGYSELGVLCFGFTQPESP